MSEIQRKLYQNATKVNAIRDNTYKIHTNKYIEHDSSKPITTSLREKGIDKYENAHIQAVTIKFARSREREHFASITSVRLFVLDFKRARQSENKSSRYEFSQPCVKLRVNKTVVV